MKIGQPVLRQPVWHWQVILPGLYGVVESSPKGLITKGDAFGEAMRNTKFALDQAGAALAEVKRAYAEETRHRP